MTDKKYTDEEIIKAFECCSADRGDCDKCALQKECKNTPFYTAAAKVALDLINRQKAEIEKLSIELKAMRNAANSYKAECEKLREKFTLDFEKMESEYDRQIKAEAYKEFAERIKEEIENAYNNNSNVLHEHMSKHAGCPNYEFIATVQGKMTALQGLDDFIDNLLKEMVGEEE